MQSTFNPTMMLFACLFAVLAFSCVCHAFVNSRRPLNTKTVLASTNEGNFFKKVCAPVVVSLGLATSWPGISLADMTMSPWSKDVQYEVVKAAPKDAKRPKVGEQVAIRYESSSDRSFIPFTPLLSSHRLVSKPRIKETCLTIHSRLSSRTTLGKSTIPHTP